MRKLPDPTGEKRASRTNHTRHTFKRTPTPTPTPTPSMQVIYPTTTLDAPLSGAKLRTRSIYLAGSTSFPFAPMKDGSNDEWRDELHHRLSPFACVVLDPRIPDASRRSIRLFEFEAWEVTAMLSARVYVCYLPANDEPGRPEVFDRLKRMLSDPSYLSGRDMIVWCPNEDSADVESAENGAKLEGIPVSFRTKFEGVVERMIELVTSWGPMNDIME